LPSFDLKTRLADFLDERNCTGKTEAADGKLPANASIKPEQVSIEGLAR
jgi:hypothetical protein